MTPSTPPNPSFEQQLRKTLYCGIRLHPVELGNCRADDLCNNCFIKLSDITLAHNAAIAQAHGEGFKRGKEYAVDQLVKLGLLKRVDAALEGEQK